MALADSPRVYFLHIPKTSGRATGLYLEAQYRRDEICPARTGDALDAVGSRALGSYRLFQGDLGASVLGRLPADTSVVTVVRDPLDRAVSHWRMIKRTPQHHRHCALVENGSTFEWFLRQMPPNPMTRLLSAAADGPYDSPRNQSDWDAAETVDRADRARARLESCAVVGVTECHDASMALIAARFGWAPPGKLPRVNAAPASQPSYEPTASERALFADRNRADLAVYPFARELFERRRRLLGIDLGRALYEDRLAAGAVELRQPISIDVATHAPGTGWLPAVSIGPGLARGIGAGGRATLDLAVRLPRFASIEIHCPVLADPAEIEQLDVRVNGARVAVTSRREAEYVVLLGAVPSPSTPPPFTRIELTAASTSPTRFGPATSYSEVDLSIAVATVVLRPYQGTRTSAPVRALSNADRRSTPNRVALADMVGEHRGQTVT